MNWSPAQKTSKAKRDCINFANGIFRYGIALQHPVRGQTIIMHALFRVMANVHVSERSEMATFAVLF